MIEIFFEFFVDLFLWTLLMPAMEWTGRGLVWLCTLGHSRCSDGVGIALGFVFWIIGLALVLKWTLHGS